MISQPKRRWINNGQVRVNRLRRPRPASAASSRLTRNGHDRLVLITGGAGFIGTNLAHRLLSDGRPVLVYDNLSRPGVIKNLDWLRATHGELIEFQQADVRDGAALREAAKRASQVFHFAAQVAVTTSLVDPILDFEINARGTLNVLEALRCLDDPPPLVFTSTNKVYGDMSDVRLRVGQRRYEPEDPEVRAYGFNETRPLNFYSPYGCSKGAACQYVFDYARTFGLPTVVFRMSCVYGLHQFGNEDQGWVAHFLIRALQGKPITIYGDGRQVRDVLFVDDLVQAFLLAQKNMPALAGHIFNIGGGPRSTMSLLELVELIGELRGAPPGVRFDGWRLADQQYYVSDTRKFSSATGWNPLTGAHEGVARLYHWLQESRPAPARFPAPPPSSRANGKAARSRVLLDTGTAASARKNARLKPGPGAAKRAEPDLVTAI